MSNRWDGLVTTIQKFKLAVKNELDKSNESFHAALNGEESLSIMGLAPRSDERNEYFVDPSDVLFWHDPTAYIDELERWEGQLVIDSHFEVKKYLADSDQANAFSRLVESLKKKRISPFVGAGLSAPCGYPLWGMALNKLVQKLEGVSKSDQRAMLPVSKCLDEVRVCIDKWEYLEAVQLLYDNHKTQLEKFILDNFDGADSKEIIGPLVLLPKLADGCIVTTNFDGLIEKIFLKENRAIEGYMHGTQSQNQFASKLIQGERCILKLHGSYNDPKTYIFSKSQYNDAYGKDDLDYTKPLSKVLRQIFISHSLLFLGCSLGKDRTLELFIDVVDSNAFDIPTHFAFLPEPAEHAEKLTKEDFLMQVKIHPIWYKVIDDQKENQDHSQLHGLLKFAIDCAAGKVKV